MTANTTWHWGQGDHDADLSDVLIPGGRYMKIVERFKYLGSWITFDGSDLTDVDSRILGLVMLFNIRPLLNEILSPCSTFIIACRTKTQPVASQRTTDIEK